MGVWRSKSVNGSAKATRF